MRNFYTTKERLFEEMVDQPAKAGEPVKEPAECRGAENGLCTAIDALENVILSIDRDYNIENVSDIITGVIKYFPLCCRVADSRSMEIPLYQFRPSLSAA